MERFVRDFFTKPHVHPDRFANGYLSPRGNYWIAPSYNIKISLKSGGFYLLDAEKSRYPVRGSNPLLLYIIRHYPDSVETDDRAGVIWCADGRVLRRAVKELNAWNDRVGRETTDGPRLRDEAMYERWAALKAIVREVLRTLPAGRYRGRAMGLLKLVRKEFPEIEREAPAELGSSRRFLELLRIWINEAANGYGSEFEIEERARAGNVYTFTLTALSAVEEEEEGALF
jgi:hypothetical protein